MFKTYLYVKQSPDNGNMGLFSSKKLKMGNYIGKLTEPYPNLPYHGKYIQHSGNANVRVFLIRDNFHLEVIREVVPGEELTLNYKGMVDGR